MTSTYNNNLLCKVCSSDSISTFGKITNGNYPADFLSKYSLLKCDKCSFKFIYPTPSDKALDFIYSAPEYSQWETFDEQGKTISTRYLNFKYYSKIISRYKKGGKFLDCGCATGLFMDVMKKEGFDCYGIETAEIPFSKTKKNHSGKVFKSNIGDMKINDGFFDVITMFDFIEHVKDPQKVLDKANRLLSDEGLLFIITPDTGSLSASILGIHHNDYIMEHLSLFNRKNIASLLEKCRFKMIKVQPAKKIINLEFAEKVFGRHTNILYYPVRLMNKILPKKISHFPLKLHFGGMFIIAKKITKTSIVQGRPSK